MKPIPFVACIATAALVPVASPSAARIGPSRVDHSCDVEINVIDRDPLGPNVRSAPDLRTGVPIARLAPVGEWIYVHVVGPSGDWLLVDRADAIDDDAPDDLRRVFVGGGWMHRDTLGFSELTTGEGTVLRASFAADSAVVRRIVVPDDEPATKRVPGCRGKSPHVYIGAGVSAWTDTWCTNERTSCS